MFKSRFVIILGSKHCPQLLKIWIDLHEDVDWFSWIRIHKHLPIYRAMVDERSSHLPVGCDHAKICGMRASQGINHILCARRMELLCVPISCCAHHFFTSQFV